MNPLQFALILSGLVYLITQSFIFRPLRKLVARIGRIPTALIYCQACTGFWVGLTLGALGLHPFTTPFLYAPIEAGIVGCGLGALWSVYGPLENVYELEQGYHDDQTKEKEVQGGDENG